MKSLTKFPKGGGASSPSVRLCSIVKGARQRFSNLASSTPKITVELSISCKGKQFTIHSDRVSQKFCARSAYNDKSIRDDRASIIRLKALGRDVVEYNNTIFLEHTVLKGTAHQFLTRFQKAIRSIKEVLTQNLKNFYLVVLEIIPF